MTGHHRPMRPVRFGPLPQGLLALALSLAPGCGSCADGDVAGPALSTGIAPYSAPAPVAICSSEGALLRDLGDRTDLPTGLCVSSGSESRPCATDASCGPREACLCGRCTVRLCTFSSECPAELSCTGAPRRCARRCSDDDGCAHGERCDAGACVAACAGDASCAFGERCIDGRCVVTTCSSIALCPSGERCDLQREHALVRAPAVLAGDESLVLVAERTTRSGDELFTARALSPSLFVDAMRLPLDATALGEPSVVRLPDGTVMVALAARDGTGLFVAHTNDLRVLTASDLHSLVLPPLSAPYASLRSPALAHDGRFTWLVVQAGAAHDAALFVARETARNSHEFMWLHDGAPDVAATLLAQPTWRDVHDLAGPSAVVVRAPTGRTSLRVFVSLQGALPELFPDAGAAATSASAIGVLAAELDVVTATLQPFASRVAGPVLVASRDFVPLSLTDPSAVQTARGWLLYAASADTHGLVVATQP